MLNIYRPQKEAISIRMPPKRARGLLMANTAILFFGLAGVLGKLTSLPAPLIVFGRTFFASLTLLTVCLLTRTALKPQRAQHTLLLFSLGALLTIHWLTFFQSILVSNVAIGLLSFSTFPLFTAILEPLILRQRPQPIQIIAALLILPGIYILVPSFSLANNITLGILWGIASGATFALLAIANSWLARSYSSILISFFQNTTATILLIPALFTSTAPFWTPRDLFLLLFLGVICTAFAHTLFIASMRTISAQTASLLASLEPVWGILFEIILLGTIPTSSTFIGGAIILSATILPSLIKNR